MKLLKNTEHTKYLHEKVYIDHRSPEYFMMFTCIMAMHLVDSKEIIVNIKETPVKTKCTVEHKLVGYVVNITHVYSYSYYVMIWQRTAAQDRLTWRWHAEAFAQPRDTTAAQ